MEIYQENSMIGIDMFFEKIYGKSHSMKLDYSNDIVMLKWRLVKRLKVFFLLIIPIVAIVACNSSERHTFIYAFILCTIILFLLVMFTTRVILINLRTKEVKSGIEIFWIRFLSLMNYKGKINIKVDRTDKYIIGSRLPLKVPIFSVELHDDSGFKLLFDESSDSELMHLLAKQIKVVFQDKI